jgi:hypothetical protein
MKYGTSTYKILYTLQKTEIISNACSIAKFGWGEKAIFKQIRIITRSS